MPYIGAKELKASDIRRFDVTSSTSATHTLTWTPPTEQSLIVTINGIKQHEDAYSVSGTTLTLSSPLVATDKLEVIGINDIGTTITPAQNSVDTDKIVNNAVTTAKIADDQITTAKIADDQITSAKLANAINITSGNSLTIDSGATITNNGTNGGGFGKVLQVVSTLKTDGYSTASATMADITGLNATITPSSTSSKILILSHIASGGPILIAYPFKLYRDSTAIAESTAGSGNNTYVGVRPGTSLQNFQITYLDSPSTTSSITYKWKTNGNGGTHSINVGSNTVYHGTSGITLLEIAG